MNTTQTGIPIIDCDCGRTHPITRRHCALCGRASLFLSEGVCLNCGEVAA